MSDPQVDITVRIPATWSGVDELKPQLADGWNLTPESLVMPDGTSLEINFRKPDDQFVPVFARACRQQPTDAEKRIVENYTVQVCLTGPGGSLVAARRMMEAAAVLIRAGGAGVFIDNSGVAHGGQCWLELTDVGTADALTFCWVAIIGGTEENYTVGMHVLGARDIVMAADDVGDAGTHLIEMMEYLCKQTKRVEDGHVIADLNGPRFLVSVIDDDPSRKNTAMHNPFGRLRLTSMADIAERN